MCGCDTKNYTLNVITEEEILSQVENDYYVFFYKDNCSLCDDVFDVISEYLQNPTEKKLYVCKIIEGSEIFKSAEPKWQGPDGRYFVDYVTNYRDLYISGVPSLIGVHDLFGFNECYFITSGRKNIINYFEKLIEQESMKN